MQATCRREAPRAFILLCFMGAAIALLLLAALHSTPSRDKTDSVEIDELSRRGSIFRNAPKYGSVHIKMASDMPFFVPPESGLLIRNISPLKE